MIFFILGILFDEFILPLVSTAAEFLVLYLEKYKSFLAIDIAKNNKQVNEITNSIEEEQTNSIAMGFHIPSTIEEDLEEDDDF